MKKCRCVFSAMVALFMLATMSLPATADFTEYGGGIVSDENEYITINGEKVDPDDPFLVWIKEQDLKVVGTDTNPENLSNNQQKRQEWIDKFYSKNPSAYLNVVAEERDAFKNLSDSIVAGIQDDYKKAYAIHDWVCSHIYYDQPAGVGSGEVSFNSDDEMLKYSQMSIFDRLMKYKRGTCGYYSGIFEQLIRSQGIPCVTITGTTGGPHAWNEIYVNGRWVNVDTTYDSSCKYSKEGQYIDGPVSHRYFDISDEDLSLTHRVSVYSGGYLILKDISAYGELLKGGTIESTDISLNAPEGATITLIVQPEDGYQLLEFSVSDNYGKELNLRPVNGTSNLFQFTMPASDVFAKAKFVLESDSKPYPNPIDMSPTISSPGETTNPFHDVYESDYFFDSAKWAIAQGITSGTSFTTFSPNQTCTKAEIITFIWRSAGSPEPKITSPFSDIATQDYFYESAIWAYENNIVEGSRFAPYDPCTRAMAVDFLWKHAGCPRVATSANFSDVDRRADYERALGWALEKGITSGTSSTTFSPNQTCTRAQIVAFLYRDMA